jgi:hypothetical protein
MLIYPLASTLLTEKVCLQKSVLKQSALTENSLYIRPVGSQACQQQHRASPKYTAHASERTTPWREAMILHCKLDDKLRKSCRRDHQQQHDTNKVFIRSTPFGSPKSTMQGKGDLVNREKIYIN